jgi:hypothetical protein
LEDIDFGSSLFSPVLLLLSKVVDIVAVAAYRSLSLSKDE